MKLYIYSLSLFFLLSCNKQSGENRIDEPASSHIEEDANNAIQHHENQQVDARISKEIQEYIDANGTYVKPKVSVYRHLISNDNTYLNIETGVYNLTGYYILNKNSNNEQFVHFDGFQKGKNINFRGFNPENYYQPLYYFQGHLDLTEGSLNGSWYITNDETSEPDSIEFNPVHKVIYPKLKFQTYTAEYEHEIYVTKIKVMIDDETQILDGFIARPISNELFLEDVNFDGYFDLRIRKDITVKSDRKNIEIFWLYNPKTKQFEVCEYLNKMNVFFYKVDAIDKILEVNNRNKQTGYAQYYELTFENGEFNLK